MSVASDAWAVDGFCPVCGKDSCDDASHVPPPNSESRTNGKAPESGVPPSAVGDFVSFRDLAKQEPPECVIEDVVYRGGITVLVGETGAGKSFVLLNMAAAVSEGHRWHGRDVIQGSVAYVAFEGDALALRCRGLEETERGIDNALALRAADPLSPTVQRDGSEIPSFGEEVLTDRLRRLSERLAAEGNPPIVLLTIDTVRASLSGSEDSSSDVSAYLRAIRRILATLPGAGAILNHHTGWQDNAETKRKRERGSSAFRGNVEITLFLEVTDDSDRENVRLELQTLKVRDSERRVPVRLIRRCVDLRKFNKFGQPLTSCVTEKDPRAYKEVIAEREAAQEAATESRQNKLLRQVLIAIRDHTPTNQSVIRGLVGGKRDDVCAAVSRLLSAELIAKAKQRDPYAITEAGERSLNESSPVVPSSPRVVPGTSPSESSPAPLLGAGTHSLGIGDE